MELIIERGREAAPGPPTASPENAGGRAEGGSGLRIASEIVAVVCAGVLAGGGAGMLAGVALGAINPYAFGLFGVFAGTVATVLPKIAGGARGGARRPWRRRWFGG